MQLSLFIRIMSSLFFFVIILFYTDKLYFRKKTILFHFWQLQSFVISQSSKFHSFCRISYVNVFQISTYVYVLGLFQRQGAQQVVLEGVNRRVWENTWGDFCLDLHLMSCGAAQAMVHAWLLNVRSIVFEGRAMPEFLRYLILDCANLEL